jgi:acetate kinase
MGGARWLLTFNAGSSSLKLGAFDWADNLRSCLRAAVRDIGRSCSTLTVGDESKEIGHVENVAAAARVLLELVERGTGDVKVGRENIAATGHRVVHGGEHFASAARIDPAVSEKLEALNHLAPLHNPHALAVIAAVEKRFPDVPAVAEFDTAFFSDLPETARTYAIPAELAVHYGIRRYGFHGLAHQYMSRQLESLAPRRAQRARVVSLHLGQGCSIAALRDGRPVETSMGFTPLEGLVMATRCGDIDAGILLYLARTGLQWHELEDLLNRKSGLLGLSGESQDVRTLLELEAQRHAGACLALGAFCHRINKYLGAYASVLRGIDTIVIGGGIGENSPAIRARLCAGLTWLGLVLDEQANTDCAGEGGRITADRSTIDVHVIPVDEESIIARATWDILQGDRGNDPHRL